MLHIMFCNIMTSGSMVQQSMVGPGRCTPQATHDKISEVYGTLRLGKKFRNFIMEQLGLQQYWQHLSHDNQEKCTKTLRRQTLQQKLVLHKIQHSKNTYTHKPKRNPTSECKMMSCIATLA